MGARMAAAVTYVTNAGRRPKRSARYPKQTYPKNAPICMVKTQPLVLRMLNPAPPCEAGAERNPGSHVKSPQYANSTDVASKVASTVLRRSGGRNRMGSGGEHGRGVRMD